MQTYANCLQVAPIITKENLEHVHHMMVFICPRESTIETDGICDELSSSFFGCFGGQVIAAWAVGGEVFSHLEMKILALKNLINNCMYLGLYIP